MALNILCTGDHEHAPWSIQDGVFDTAREAEYTPQLAKHLQLQFWSPLQESLTYQMLLSFRNGSKCLIFIRLQRVSSPLN